MMKRSIQYRLQLWFGGLLTLLVIGFGWTVFELQRTYALQQLDHDLEQRLQRIHLAVRAADMNRLRNRPPLADAPRLRNPNARRLPLALAPLARPPRPPLPPLPPRSSAPVTIPQSVIEEYPNPDLAFYVIWNADGLPLAQTEGLLSLPPPPPPSISGAILHHNFDRSWRHAYMRIGNGHCALVAYNMDTLLLRQRRLAWILVGAGSTVLLIGFLGGWFFSRLSLRSIRRISDTARHISGGNLSERISTADMDCELGQLAGVLNQTFARLDAAFERQQQFTADAAHELRTPLAVILSDTQTALLHDRSPEAYRDTLRSCENAAQSMRHLTESLLELARLDDQTDRIDRRPADLAALLARCADNLQPLALRREVTFRLNLPFTPVLFPCVEEQMAHVFINLMNNALDYTPPASSVDISIQTSPGGIEIVIADAGPGIAPDDLPHIFERFYRASRSRTGEGHSGLGLAICKAIMDTHGSSISAENGPSGGARMILRFPL